MEYSAVIVAAGNGSRMGLGYNKVYALLDDGRMILMAAITPFLNDPDCREIVIVTDPLEFRQHFTYRFPGRIVLCGGGETRQESVWNGLHAAVCDTVLIHDGARPFIKEEDLQALKEAMETEDAAVLMVPCKDTIKRVKDGYVEETFNRSELMAAQTPQAFRTQLIISCLEKAIRDGFTGTDDAMIVERYSHTKIKAVSGSYANRKITTPEDI